MTRTSAELAIVGAMASMASMTSMTSMIACGGDSDPASADTGDGTGAGTVDGTGDDGGPGPDDGGTADDAGSTGAPAVGCGNGVVEDGEICDDGPQNGAYGSCSESCDTVLDCGDGIVQRDGGEVCDSGITNGRYDECAADCSGPGPRCGDGVVQEVQQEACDDANEVDGDGCNAGCVLGGQLVTSWTVDISEGEPERPHTMGMLPDGRFYLAGWATDDSRPFLAAFDTDDGAPFHTWIAPEDGGGYRSAVTMPDGRVLVSGDGTNAFNQQLALRSFLDLDAPAQEHAHILDGGYNVRAAALRSGGHVLCNNAVDLGLQYYAPLTSAAPEWEIPNVDCHAVAADASGVAHLWIDQTPAGGQFVSIRVYLHGGLPKWTDEFSSGAGGHDLAGAAFDSASNLLVVGAFEPADNPEVEYRPLLRKYDADGKMLWGANAMLTTVSEWTGVAVDALDNVVVAGYHRLGVTLDGVDLEVDRPIVRKYSPDGDLLWSWQDDDWNEDAPYSSAMMGVGVDPNGEIVAGGWSEGPGAEDDLRIVRLTP